MRLRASAVIVAMVASFAGTVAVTAPSAQAFQTSNQGALPSAKPVSWTPEVLGDGRGGRGKVVSIAQVGNLIIIGGLFNQVQDNKRGLTLNRTNIAAFDATTGAVSDGFNPQLNGQVDKVLAASDGTSVFVGGDFTTLNGAGSTHLLKLNAATGAPVSAFTAQVKGAVTGLDTVGNRLFVGGQFQTVNGKNAFRLAEVDATTGKTSHTLNVDIEGTQHGTGTTSVETLDASPDGQHVLITGNFGTINGAVHNQVAEFTVTPTGLDVDAWHAPLFDANVCNPLYNQWVMDAQFSPDSSYFVVDGTGAYGNGLSGLCDSVERWSVDPTNANASPTWVEKAGGDSFTSVEVTDTAIYVGGHFRWLNNPFCGDTPCQGAIDYRGLGALDPVNGLPLDWNPGGVIKLGYYDFLPTDKGLFVGGDYLVTGNCSCAGLAYFPLAGGHTPPASTVATLPVDVTRLGQTGGGGQTNVLYRIDAAGPALPAIDNGPDWAADNSDPSLYRPNGSNIAGYDTVANVNPVVPSSTPIGIYSQERWYPDDASGHWSFPVAAGTHVQVRLYFANRYTGTSQAGQRVFNVNVDGQTFLNHYDIVADTGDQTGTMKSIDVTSPGAITIDFQHVNENPLINGIELINQDVPPPAPGSGDTVDQVAYDGTSVGAPTSLPGNGIAWGNARGAFDINGNAYVAMANGTLTKQTFDGTNFGTPSVVNLNGLTNFASEMQQMTGMFYLNGHIYYTQAGSSQLFSRGFSADLDVVDANESVVANNLSDVDWSQVRGMFYANGNLYWVNHATGDLMRTAFVNGAPQDGTTSAVSGPGIDSATWGVRALLTTAATTPNTPPVAVPQVTCTGLTCSADGSASHDAEGPIASYSWTFDDGGTASGAHANHTYLAGGTYTVTLKVTDSGGLTNSATQQVTVAPVGTAISYVGGSAAAPTSTYVKTFTTNVPAGVQAGNEMLLFGAVNATSADATLSAPAGWTLVRSVSSTTDDIQGAIWSKVATGTDAGSAVTMSSSKSAKATLQLVAYNGTSATNPIVDSALTSEGTASKTHVTPTLSNGIAGSWLVSFWSEKTSTTTASWTTTTSGAQRNLSVGLTGAHVSSLLMDSNAPVATGTVGGNTATGAAKLASDLMGSVLLRPGS